MIKRYGVSTGDSPALPAFFLSKLLKNVPRLVIDVMSLSAVEIVVDKPDAVVEIVDEITLNGSENTIWYNQR